MRTGATVNRAGPSRNEPPGDLDFFEKRFAPASHVLQSATRALKTGMDEEVILACLLHDTVLTMLGVDHGWWGAQLYEPTCRSGRRSPLATTRHCASTRTRSSGEVRLRVSRELPAHVEDSYRVPKGTRLARLAIDTLSLDLGKPPRR